MAAASFGCFFSPTVEPDDCALRCWNDQCPNGFECREVREGVGYCVAVSSSRLCDPTLEVAEPPPGKQLGPEAKDSLARERPRREFFAARPWFGFVDAALGPRRLVLVDPVALEAGDPPLRLPASLDAAESVVDFQFAPGGRWLAVRIEIAGRRHLSLFEAPRWELLGSTDEETSVDEYAWAPHEPVLAFAGEKASTPLLGALRVLDADAAAPRPRLLVQPATPAPAAATLTWFGERGIAFHSGTDRPENRILYSGQLGEAGFVVAPFIGASYQLDASATLALVPGSSGFFAVARAPGTALIDHYTLGPGGLARRVQRPNVLLSPAGDYLAASVNGALELYAAGESRVDPLEGYPMPAARGGGCEVVLAWSHEGDRVACGNDNTRGAGLRMFRIPPMSKPSAPRLDSGVVGLEGLDVEGSELYSGELSLRRRRGFSPGGRWFLFSTDHELYAVDLLEARLGLAYAPARFESALVSSDFIPSPDGQWLVTHQGPWLARHAIVALSDANAITSAQLDAPPPCTEGDAHAPSGACAAASTRSPLVAWSPDSRAIALGTTDSELLLIRIQPSEREDRLSAACDLACIETSAFQPLAPPR
jgi:hypothetical protein